MLNKKEHGLQFAPHRFDLYNVVGQRAKAEIGSDLYEFFVFTFIPTSVGAIRWKWSIRKNSEVFKVSDFTYEDYEAARKAVNLEYVKMVFSYEAESLEKESIPAYKCLNRYMESLAEVTRLEKSHTRYSEIFEELKPILVRFSNAHRNEEDYGTTLDELEKWYIRHMGK